MLSSTIEIKGFAEDIHGDGTAKVPSLYPQQALKKIAPVIKTWRNKYWEPLIGTCQNEKMQMEQANMKNEIKMHNSCRASWKRIRKQG